eukprot:Skav211703  [mRNA]  locus=scaffold1535:233330:233651:- [translate_table: standard]
MPLLPSANSRFLPMKPSQEKAVNLSRIRGRRVWTLFLREMLQAGLEGIAKSLRLEEGIFAPFNGFAAHMLLPGRGKVFDFTLASHAVKKINHEGALL